MIKNNLESGQSLVVIAVCFLAIVAVAALVIDGGSLYLNRRNAQTAADAAAMAGAHELCVKYGSRSAVVGVVDTFAETNNGATEVENVTVCPMDATCNKAVKTPTVSVQTRVDTASFFARIMGFNENTVRAQAKAGCFPPASGDRLLPIAWTCRPPAGGSTGNCTIHSIPWTVFQKLYTSVSPPNPWFNFNGQNGKTLTEGDGVNYETYTDTDNSDPADNGGVMTYILMDSNKFNQQTDCMEYGGTIHCDLNDDGVLDVEGGANRGWLYLGSKGGAVALRDIMLYGYPDPIAVPQWFPGTNGVAATVFDAADTIKYTPVFVPVFNAMCSGTTATNLPTNCPSEYVTGDLINGENPGSTYYRVPGFSAFVVTCVYKTHSDKCPARNMAGIDTLQQGNSIKTIEGYFVSGFTGDAKIDQDGFYLGVYIISLIE